MTPTWEQSFHPKPLTRVELGYFSVALAYGDEPWRNRLVMSIGEMLDEAAVAIADDNPGLANAWLTEVRILGSFTTGSERRRFKELSDEFWSYLLPVPA